MKADTQIKKILADACRSLYGIELDSVHIEHPLNRTWGDYSSNIAMANSKVLGKSPTVLANEITAKITNMDDSTKYFESVKTAGPGFINFTLSKEYLLDEMQEVLKKGDAYGRSDLGAGKKVALEHSNVNPNKAAHVGHLRNAVIGQFIERVYEYIGYDVNVQYYSNDLGVQVSTSLLGTEMLGDTLKPESYQKFDHYAWDVYASISAKLSEDDTLKSRLDRIMMGLENRDPDVSERQKVLARKVLKENLVTFSKLDIDYDVIIHESTIKDMYMWDTAFNILKNNEHVYLAEFGASKGCWLIRMGNGANNDYVEEDKIIVRSNGVPTYTGKDIAYHMWKYGLLGIDFLYCNAPYGTQKKALYETDTNGDIKMPYTSNEVVIDVIDVKQTYAISSIKKTLEYLGYIKQSENLIHVNYGHVYLSKETVNQNDTESEDTGKGNVSMSGRKGTGVKIDDFIEMVEKTLKERYGQFPNVEHIRNSAIKFDLLRYDTYQDVTFDIKESLNMKGFSGPYIQYTHARACSLIEKAKLAKENNTQNMTIHPSNLNTSAVEVLRELYKFPEVLLESSLRFAPNALCVYLYELCQTFNKFYNDSPVLNEKDENVRSLRLLITDSVRQVLKNGLYLLGITAVDKM